MHDNIIQQFFINWPKCEKRYISLEHTNNMCKTRVNCQIVIISLWRVRSKELSFNYHAVLQSFKFTSLWALHHISSNIPILQQPIFACMQPRLLVLLASAVDWEEPLEDVCGFAECFSLFHGQHVYDLYVWHCFVSPWSPWKSDYYFALPSQIHWECIVS